MLKFRNINETSHHINLIMRTPDGFIYSLSNVLVKGEVVTVNNDPFSTPINNKVVTMVELRNGEYCCDYPLVSLTKQLGKELSEYVDKHNTMVGFSFKVERVEAKQLNNGRVYSHYVFSVK